MNDERRDDPSHRVPDECGAGESAPERWIASECSRLGFATSGIAPARATDHARAFAEWVAAGRHGEMGYLAEHVELRLDPTAFVPGARSIVCVADRYHDGAADPARGAADGPHGRIARYARGLDYHKVIRKRLHALADACRTRWPAETFRACVDTAPLLEREHAARAGLGAIGKHTLLIESGAGGGTSVGSWILIGAVVTTLEIEPSVPFDAAASAEPDDPCGACTRCIDACPTNAIAPWQVDATRCISYLTIEHRTPIDDALAARMGDWIFGCDVCQEVCPHNQPTTGARRAERHDAYAPRLTGFPLLEVLGWTEEDRRAAFERSAMKRAKLDMMKRNAIIAAGNALQDHDDAALRHRIAALAVDPAEPELVRDTARATLARLG